MGVWSKRLGAVGALAIVVGVAATGGWALATSWHPSLDSYPIQGIDVSDEAGAIDWAMAHASGADFAYMRATMGDAGRDTLFAANWAGAFGAGMRRGAVHDFALCRLAADQAHNFTVVVPRVTDALPAAVSIDDDPSCATPPSAEILAGEVARFIAVVERHTGKPVLLRISPAIERRYALSARIDRTLWATGNFFPPSYLSRPWRMWRANALRRIDGADRAVGWDVVAR